MVENFAVFADRLATLKIKTMIISMGGENDDVIVNDRTIALTHHAGERSIERSTQPC